MILTLPFHIIQTGTLRYCGPTEFASGVWAGIELDDEAGKNDGSIGGISYFTCSPRHGNLVPRFVTFCPCYQFSGF